MLRFLLLLNLLAGPFLWAEWQAGGYVGGARTQAASVRFQQPDLATDFRAHDVAFEGRSWNAPIYYGYRLGWMPGRSGSGIEAEFIHLKVHARVDRPVNLDGAFRGAALKERAPLDSLVQRFDISHGMNLLLGNFVYRRGRVVRLAFRAGAGATIPHPESNVMGAAHEAYELGRPAIQISPGVEWRITRWLLWFAEYKYTWTNQRVTISGGQARVTLHSHHLVTGPALVFGRSN